MVDQTTSGSDTPPPADSAPKEHFSRAVDEARAGAQALGKQAQDLAGAYADKVQQVTNDLGDQARVKSDEARDRAYQLANDGKKRASDAISTVAKLIEDNAALVDERAGVRYGDYVRGAARSVQGTADRIDAKDMTELVDDAREFVRNSPAIAVGIAAAGGFLLARLFRGGGADA